MLGLIYKDLLIIKKEIFLNIFAMVGMTIPVFLPWEKMIGTVGIGLVNGYSMSYVIMPVLMYFFVYSLIGGLQNGLFAHDENRCYSSWVVSTPMTVKGQVLSKYYCGLIFLFAGLIWCMICDIIASFVNGAVGSTMGIAIVYFFLQMFISAFELPFIVRFGHKNGTTFKVAMMLCIVFVGIVYGLFGPLPDADVDSLLMSGIRWMMEGSNMSTLALGIFSLAPFLAVFLYYVSYKVSVRMYLKGVENYEH